MSSTTSLKEPLRTRMTASFRKTILLSSCSNDSCRMNDEDNDNEDDEEEQVDDDDDASDDGITLND